MGRGKGSLNHDPFNLRAEELALEDVISDRDVRRTWTEAELVRSFAGQLTPGTPDGMVELWEIRHLHSGGADAHTSDYDCRRHEDDTCTDRRCKSCKVPGLASSQPGHAA